MIKAIVGPSIRITFTLLMFSIFSVSSFANNSSSEAEDNYRALMNLLDYLSRDYPNAISNGEIINDFEYQEMLEFSRQTKINFENLTKSRNLEGVDYVISMLTSLEDSVKGKASSSSIKNQSEQVKQVLLDLGLFPNIANEWPNLVEASKLFALHCTSCHGEKGDGSGAAGIALNPKPSNFLNESLADNLSPLQCFNTIKMGLPGTAMVSFKQLSDKEIWSLSFYILSLSFDSSKAHKLKEGEMPITLEDASLLSNVQLSEKHGNNPDYSIAKSRNYHILKPVEVPMDKAVTLLDQSFWAYKEKEYDKSMNLALKAYLEGIEPYEQRIAASDARLLGELETSMMAVRSSIQDKEEVQIVQTKIDQAKSVIHKSQELISNQERSISFTAFLAASILVREGLEAFLIIIAILGILRSLNASRAINYVHAGWMAALLVGVIGWFYVDGLSSWDVQNRELFEGLIALFAVVVLLYMGFWLHSKTEIGKWKQFVEVKIKKLVEGNNLFGLSFFAFIVVFREAFESVIFLSSLRVDSGADRSMGIWIGIAVAVVIVFVLSWGILKFFNKVPLRKVFLYSSIMIAVIAVILAGDGVHALQEGGIISATISPVNVRIPLLGIYPSVECLMAQLVSLIVIAGLWMYNKKKGMTPSKS